MEYFISIYKETHKGRVTKFTDYYFEFEEGRWSPKDICEFISNGERYIVMLSYFALE